MKQALIYSISSACVAGLLFGGVMKLGPDALAERGGPQILIPGEAGRSLAPDGGSGPAVYSSHNGEIPEYVLGSDWTRPADDGMAGDVYLYDADYGEEPLPAEPEPRVADAVFVAPVKISSPPPPKPVSYPSLDGDILGGSPAEPDALAEVVETQEETDSLPS